MYLEEEKIFSGQLFDPADEDLRRIKLLTHNQNLEYNALPEDATDARQACLKKVIGKMGNQIFIQGPMWFHYGSHTTIGNNFFANINFTVQGDAPVFIGNNCNFGPNVTIVTPLHPLIAHARRAIKNERGIPRHLCYARPVRIGDDC